jgi:hypothetical protein
MQQEGGKSDKKQKIQSDKKLKITSDKKIKSDKKKENPQQRYLDNYYSKSFVKKYFS